MADDAPHFRLKDAIVSGVNLFGLNIADIQNNERNNH